VHRQRNKDNRNSDTCHNLDVLNNKEQWRSDWGAGVRAAPGGTCWGGKGAKNAEN